MLEGGIQGWSCGKCGQDITLAVERIPPDFQLYEIPCPSCPNVVRIRRVPEGDDVVTGPKVAEIEIRPAE